MAASHPLSFRQNPSVYLSLFLVSNALISFSRWPMTILVWVGLLGIILPLYVALRTLPSQAGKPGYLADLKLPIPTWLFGLALLVMIFLRFVQLETLPCWPNLDEGWIGALAIKLSRHWTWKFFYTFGETPPLSIWCPALLFKLGCSPAFSLWFPPAVVSLLTVFVAYGAARQFFSKSLSMVLTGLMAFSFWPLYIGRICHQGIWLPLWVYLVLFLWGGFQRTMRDKVRRNWALGLGFGLGFGSFTFTPWMPVAGVFSSSFAWEMLGKKKKDWKNFLCFGATFLLSLIPFLTAIVREGYGHHITSLSPWGGWFKEFTFFTSFFKYFAVLVWDSYEKDPAYTPVWGGFLNPLLGAFFFMGIIEMAHQRRQKCVQWIAAAFFLFLLPGALSPNLETFRVVQVLPLLLFITAWGLHGWLAGIPLRGGQAVVLSLILILTGFWDFDRVIGPYQDLDAHPENFGRPLKSLEKYRAYEVLKDYRRSRDEGLILTDLDPSSLNEPTLSVMTYPSKVVAEGKSYQGFNEPDPLIIFVNVHYQPFLKDRIPGLKWFPLYKDLPADQGQDMLCLLFGGPSNIGQWCQVHAVFQRADLQRFSQDNGAVAESLKTLESAYPLIQGDPFLESVFWDKRAAYEYEALNYEEQLRSYQMAVTRGYPTADLYYKMGQLYLVKQRYAEAKEAFLRATQAPLDLTLSKSMLEWLKAQPAANPPSK